VVNSSLTSVGTLVAGAVPYSLLTGNVPIWNQNTTGNAATATTATSAGTASTATQLTTPRNINGVAFDGSADITIAANAGTLTGTTLAANVVNSSLTSVGTLVAGAVPYSLLTGNVPIWNQNTTGNAATATTATTAGTASTATKLATSRNINGVAFDGSADITVAADAGTLTGTTLASNVVNSSLTSVGTITSGTWSGTTISITNGGTGSNTKNFVDLTTAQTVAGAKTFTTDAIVNGITVGKGGGNVSNNTATGADALKSNTTGSYNTAIGTGTLYNNTTGASNTAIGFMALNSNTTGGDGGMGPSKGDNNTAIGNSALQYNTTGSNNTASGTTALYYNTTGYFNTATGNGSLKNNSIGHHNTASGNGALSSNTTGNYNTADGNEALLYNSTGNYNTASGGYALSSNTTGNFNTASGGYALRSNTTGSNNTASGGYALSSNTTGSNNTASGGDALSSNTTGSNNTASGLNALSSNTSGSTNTAIGTYALSSNSSGSNNTASSGYALSSNTTGSYNTASGVNALISNSTGSNNTAIGYGADVGANNLTNATAIGKGAIVSASNTIQLGNTDVTNVKTSGTLTAGDVTYPRSHGNPNQVLSTTGSGTLTWTTPSTTATAYSGTLPVENGGTGAATLTANNVLLGNGTSALQAVAPGTTGNILTSNGTTWTSSAPSGTHTIGESYGGGIVFYVYDNGKHGLIAATSDQSTGIRWYGGSSTNTRARADGVGAGLKNTAIIIANQGAFDGDAFAATVCNEYSVTETVGGITTTYGDWYLPSKYELNLMYLARSTIGGGLENNDYWSSTETNYATAWFQSNGSSGAFYSLAKNYTGGHVRAIRAF